MAGKRTHPGTGLWRAWSVFDPASVDHIVEYSLYSDAWFTNIVREPGWPVELMPALPNWFNSGVKFAAVARMRWSSDPSFDPSTVKLKTDTRSHHGGDSGDEIAALVSLALGVRCRNGGITRRWMIDDERDWDALGMPIEEDHRPPFWQPPRRNRPMFPALATQVDLAEAQPLMQKFASTSPSNAALLVRAARLYSSALWIADSDGNYAWLQMVSALETVAATAAGTRPLWRRVKEAMPDVWAELVRVGGQPHAEAVGTLLAPLARSTDRFLNFVERYAPPSPDRRPELFAQLDWDDLRVPLRAVYGLRSRALHDGTPFPDPMCEPAMTWGTEIPVEKPPWKSSSTGFATWAAEDVPMFLHTFEYIVRSVLLAWWKAL